MKERPPGSRENRETAAFVPLRRSCYHRKRRGGSIIHRDERLRYLAELERKVLWLSTWMIHNANFLRPNEDGLKVGGHQASSASLVGVMTALYFHVLRAEDRVAVKPHASPVFHAIQYLLGNQTRENLERYREFGGAQPYPSRTKDTDDVDFSGGSVGLGVTMTSFASLVQDYVRAKGWSKDRPAGRMVALVGDAELDEGNVFEALLEGWKHGLRNTWWIIDYNRQSLDAVIHEGLYGRIEDLFHNMGWEVVALKYGHLLEAAFAEPGGGKLRDWIDLCPNQLYSALTFQGGEAWRRRLLDDFGGQSPVTRLIEGHSDDELHRLMTNLGGHDLATLLAAFESIDHDRPVCFIAYTIKGFGLPIQGHKDNHSGLMTPQQMEGFRASMNVRSGHEWEPFEGLTLATEKLRTFLDAVPFNAKGRRRMTAKYVEVPETLSYRVARVASTQDGFGRILNDLAGGKTQLAERIVTASPDVTVSTNLGAWVNRRGLFAREHSADVFRQEQVASALKWESGPEGQHFELGIAEMNLFALLSALGLSHSLFGVRLVPIGTLYDIFIQRGLDALNYACYQDSRFIVVGTPSGITLAPEGGAHQSIGTPLIGMAQDGLAAFEPAFVDELGVILAWAFDYIQRDGGDRHEEGNWLRDETGGSVYLRLSSRRIEQPGRKMTPALLGDIIDGAYWMREPGPNAEVVIAYTGVVAPGAIMAAGLISEDRRDVGVLAITSADRLNAGWQAAERARLRGQTDAMSHIERLLKPLSRDCGIVTVIDGHPATLSWLGGVYGHPVISLGVEHFGQTGTVRDLYRHHGIDTDAIVNAVRAVVSGRPIRRLHVVN